MPFESEIILTAPYVAGLGNYVIFDGKVIPAIFKIDIRFDIR